MVDVDRVHGSLMRNMRSPLVLVTGLLAAALVSGCGADPNVEKQRLYERGNAFFAEEKYAEASIEYRGALQLDPQFAAARYRLAETFDKLEDRGNALREYVRAADLMANKAAPQLKAAEYLLRAQQWEDARARATSALELDDRNVEGHIVRGSALAGLNELDSAVEDIERAIALDPKETRGYLSLGTI